MLELWKEYTEKAESKGVNPLYFRLPLYRIGPFPPRDISPEYRYLEVLTQERLREDSAASYIRSKGEILGIYESLDGVIQGILRNEPELTLFFTKRLRPESKEVLIKEFREERIFPLVPFATKAFRELSSYLFQEGVLSVELPIEPWQIYTEESLEKNELPLPQKYPNYATYDEALYYLISQGKEEALEEALLTPTNIEKIFLATLRSGEVSLLNRVLYLRKELGIPDYGETVEEVIGEERPSFTLPDQLPPLEKIPRTGKVPDYYFSAAIYGGNPLIYDFLLSLQGKDPQTIDSFQFFTGYFSEGRRDKSGFYQILARLPARLVNSDFALNVDLAILSFAKGLSPLQLVERNLGDVDILLTFLPYLKKEEIDLSLFQGYPLSKIILQNL